MLILLVKVHILALNFNIFQPQSSNIYYLHLSERILNSGT